MQPPSASSSSSFSSPFLSPPPKRHHIASTSRSQQRPLVLDPSQPNSNSNGNRNGNTSGNTNFSGGTHHGRTAEFTPAAATSRDGRTPLTSRRTPMRTPFSGSGHARSEPKSSHTPMVQKFITAAARGITSPVLLSTSSAAVNTPYRSSHMMVHTTPLHVDEMRDIPASERARTAAHAGFLQKLGANVPEFKRRFFMVEPTTHLSYFVSPHDTEPRGRLDLEGSRVEEVESLPDGRYRFAVLWDGTDRRVVLEARSKDVGRKWMESLRKERVSYLQTEVEAMNTELSARDSKIQDLHRQIENYKMIEKDRDGAMEDARHWKQKFEELDDALRRLTLHLRDTMRSDSSENGAYPTEKQSNDVIEPKNDEESPSEADEVTSENDAVSQRTNLSLLDITTDEDNMSPDPLLVPGVHFSALLNACQQHHELLRLTSAEAATAVKDVQQSTENLNAMTKRMKKAEKHICQLWEENCAIRKTLKQKKRERRVLIHEVKALQRLVTEETQEASSDTVAVSGSDDANEGMVLDESSIASDEERLINELEEHVASSIRLHEKFLVASGKPNPRQSHPPLRFHLNEKRQEAAWSKEQKAPPRSESTETTGSGDSPLKPKLLSLFDDEEESDDGGSADSELELKAELQDVHVDMSVNSQGPSSISSVVVEADVMSTVSEPISTNIDDNSYLSRSTDSPLGRKNPLVALDDDDDGDDLHCVALGNEPAELERMTVITENGHASSRLVCPLQDVTETLGSAFNSGDSRVYHLSFESQKIGIQFQKVPPAPAQGRGLLTAAMTSDLDDHHDNSNKTASELRSIAWISSLVKQTDMPGTPESAVVARPKDVVLVCGFEGFDDSGCNERPKLGARLVAFDGVSVEIGNWTFDSIRTAIKARGRPLTLSFRNDFLTTEQRQILTRAVNEVSGTSRAPPPINGIIQYRDRARPPSTTPSLTSAISHETDHFINGSDADAASIPGEVDGELDISASVTSSTNCWYNHRRTFSTTSSVTSNHRSFSESGSSSVLSTTIAPLMANLLKGVKERRGSAPEYLSRESASVDGIPEHKAFQSNLL